MAAKKAAIFIALIFHLAGCLEGEGGGGIKEVVDNTSRAEWKIIAYLQSEKLPALKSVEPWPNEYGAGVRLTTEHYEILTTLPDQLILRKIPAFMEAAHRQYQNQLFEPVESKIKFTVYVFGERNQWEAFTEKFAGEQAELYLKIKEGAYYLNGACVVYNIGRDRIFSVLGHEGWHQFNSRHFRYRLPSWLDEGVAMLFEANRYEKGRIYFEPDRNLSRLAGLKMTLINGKMIPLEKLIAINPGEVIESETDDRVRAFYSQAYGLVRFLREEGYGKRLGAYRKLLSDGLDGKWPLTDDYKRIAADRNILMRVEWNRAMGSQLFRYYFGEDSDLGAIEKEYIAFCRKIVYHVKLRR